MVIEKVGICNKQHQYYFHYSSPFFVVEEITFILKIVNCSTLSLSSAFVTPQAIDYHLFVFLPYFVSVWA